MEKTTQMALGSSNLKSIKYNDATEDLTIYFRSGAIYIFHDVEYETVEELKFADSKGQYFFTRIRDNYSFTKVRGSRPGFSHAFNTAKSTAQHHFGPINPKITHSPENR